MTWVNSNRSLMEKKWKKSFLYTFAMRLQIPFSWDSASSSSEFQVWDLAQVWKLARGCTFLLRQVFSSLISYFRFILIIQIEHHFCWLFINFVPRNSLLFAGHTILMSTPTWLHITIIAPPTPSALFWWLYDHHLSPLLKKTRSITSSLLSASASRDHPPKLLIIILPLSQAHFYWFW